jgi:hypothetical protein
MAPVGLPAEVNFTNILRAAFLYKSFLRGFICLQFGFVIFWRKDFGAKAAHKMLVKLTPGGSRFENAIFNFYVLKNHKKAHLPSKHRR